MASFRNGLEQLGWVEGRNVRIEARYAGGRTEQYRFGVNRMAASCVDRILRGAKPSDLPVEAPTKYETTINLKTANP